MELGESKEKDLVQEIQAGVKVFKILFLI